MNEAYIRLTHRTLNAAKRRKSSGAKLNSSLKNRKSSSVNCAAYERYTYKTKRPDLSVKTAEEIRAVLSAYISSPILVTNVTNIKGDVIVNYRILDDNIDRELAQNEIIAGLDYIEAITDDTALDSNCNMNCDVKSVTEAVNKYKELLNQCYIAVYEHGLDANDPQIVEYQKQMNELVDEYGYIYNTLDAYIKALNKKYGNTIDFTAENLDSGLFNKKEKPSLEILQIYKQLKNSIDNLVKAGTPKDNATLKSWQEKAADMEKKYDAKSLKLALASARDVTNNEDLDIADHAAEVITEYKLINRNFKKPVAVSFSVAESTQEYNGFIVALDNTRNYVLETINGIIPEGADPIQEVLNDYREYTGTTKFDECSEEDFQTKAQAIRELADAEKTVRETNEQIANAEAFKEEYGEYPDEWDPLKALFDSEIEGLGD